MNKSKKHKALFIILGIILSIFSILFFCSKEFRFNVAIRFIALIHLNPLSEIIYSIDSNEDSIIITKYIVSSNDIDEQKNKYKISLTSSLKTNDAIYEMQRSNFWCDNIKAVCIDSDTYLMNPARSISVGTGQGSYFYYGEYPVFIEEGKWVIIRHLDETVKDECEAIVLEYDDYEFSRE